MSSQKSKNFLIQSFSLVFKDSLFVALALSLALNLLAFYYLIFLETTTLNVFFSLNSAFYNWTSIISTIIISLFFGIAVSLLIWQWRRQKELNPAHLGNSFLASFFGAISTGCPICGAFLASILGIGGGLTAFPFQGLGIKAISLGLLSFAIISSAKSISKKTCETYKPILKEASLEDKKLLAFKEKTIKFAIPAFIGLSFLLLVIYLPSITNKFNFRFSFQPSSRTDLLATTPSLNNSFATSIQVDSSEILLQNSKIQFL